MKFNLQLFADDDFANKLSEKLGVSGKNVEVAESTISKDNDAVNDSVEVDEHTEDKSTDAENVKAEENKQNDNKTDDKPEKKERDLEKDAAFAKLRREKEELQKRLQTEQEARDKWYAENFAEYGISTEEQYRQALIEQKKTELEEQALNGDEEAIQSLIELKAEEKTNEAVRLAKETAKIEIEIPIQLDALNKEYGLDFKSYNDFYNAPNGNIAHAILSQSRPDGSYPTMLEAYEMVNIEAVKNKVREKTQQELRNKANGYNHTKTDAKPSGDMNTITLDADTLKFYEKMGIKPDLEFIKKMKK